MKEKYFGSIQLLETENNIKFLSTLPIKRRNCKIKFFFYNWSCVPSTSNQIQNNTPFLNQLIFSVLFGLLKQCSFLLVLGI